MPSLSDQWSSGTTYEHFMGRWSRALAREFITWLRSPDGADWLDLGCGTGAMTDAICNHANPRSVVACDPAPSFLDFAREHVRDPRVRFEVADDQTFPLTVPPYSTITSLLSLNFFPSPDAAIARMRAASGVDAIISACVWDYGAGMQFLRIFWDAATEVAEAARQLDEGVRFPLCTRENLIELFARGGLRNVQCEALEIPTVFASFEDFWRPLTLGTGPAPAFVQTLGETDRLRLRSTLQERMSIAPDGSLPMVARSWAVRANNHHT